jgi:hypothetical protein
MRMTKIVSILMVGSSLVLAACRPAPPLPPTDLAATTHGFTSIDLRWVDNALNESGFRLDRAANDTFSSALVMVRIPKNAVSYTDTPVTDGATYYYRLCAVNAGGTSAVSNTMSVTTPSLRILSATSPVRPGGTATLIAQTITGARCSISVNYLSGPGEAQGLQPTPIAGTGGRVSWTWLVGTRTTPGTWPIDVTASYEGETITKRTTQFTVIR